VTVARLIWGWGRTSMPWPGLKTAGPMWSKKMKGPTRRRLEEGSRRRTEKPPRSRGLASITSSTNWLSPFKQTGSFDGSVLMDDSLQNRFEEAYSPPFLSLRLRKYMGGLNILKGWKRRKLPLPRGRESILPRQPAFSMFRSCTTPHVRLENTSF